MKYWPCWLSRFQGILQSFAGVVAKLNTQYGYWNMILWKVSGTCSKETEVFLIFSHSVRSFQKHGVSVLLNIQFIYNFGKQKSTHLYPRIKIYCWSNTFNCLIKISQSVNLVEFKLYLHLCKLSNYSLLLLMMLLK